VQLIDPEKRRLSLVVFATGLSVAGEDDDIKVRKEEISATQRKLTVTIPAAMTKECFNATVDNLRGVVGNLQGFRRDKIPLSMIITQCGGQRAFKLSVIEEIMTKTLPQVMKGVGDALVPDSEKISSNINELEVHFDPAKSFTFEIEYETSPPIKWLKPYKEAQVSINDTGDFNTDMAAVDDLLRQILKQKGFQRVVVGRGLQKGDTCIMDIDVRSKSSKQPMPGLCKTRFPLDTELDPLQLLKGMEGMLAGDERKFSITFPRDYNVELWRGMDADVTVKVHEVFNWALPEFNDEFVKAHYSSKFSDADDMKKALLAETAMMRVKDMDKQLEDKVLEAVVSCMEVLEVPEKLVIDMGANAYRQNLMYMMNKRMATQEDIEKLLTEDLVDDYISKNRKDLEDMVKFNLAVDAIFEAESLTVDAQDIDAEMKLQEEQYKEQKLEYDIAAVREQVVDSFKHVRVIEWLKDTLPRTVVPYQAQPF